MPRLFFVLFLAVSILTLGACANQSAAGKEVDYETTKKMVVDILQTEDGKKAIQEILTDEKMKQNLVINADVVQEAINKALSSEKGQQMWTKLFSDPAFVKTYAKSMADQQKKLMKSLMNDAEFQKQMLELLKDPAMADQYLEVLKSQEFTAHLEETIQKTLETPLFQAKIQEILLKAASEQQKGKGGESGGQGGGGSQGKEKGSVGGGSGTSE